MDLTPLRRPALGTALAALVLTASACSPATPGAPESTAGAPAPESTAGAPAPESTAGAPARVSASDSPASTADVAPASPSSAPRTVSLNVSGDLLWNPIVWAGARRGSGWDFTASLASLRPFIEEADLAVCHQEVPIAPPGGPYTGYPRFAAPEETVAAVAAAGFDACTTSSNHTLDSGMPGLTRTLDVLHRNGLQTTGSWATEQEARAPHLLTTAEGVKVGVVSMTYALERPDQHAAAPWSVDVLDVDDAVAQAKAARSAGAEIVVMHMHAGDEYTHRPKVEQRSIAEALSASGEFDLITGQHPHWVQPIAQVNGTYVVYSTGNLIAGMPGERPGTHDGAMVQVDFTRDEGGRFAVSGVTWAPTFITDADHDPTGASRVLLIPDELDAASPALRARLEASAARTRKVITSYGTPGLRERTAPSS